MGRRDGLHILRRRMAQAMSIIGATGDLGYGLAVRWAQAGAAVTIGSRDAGRAAEAAARVAEVVPGGTVQGLANEDAAAAAEVVVMSVPFGGQAATYKSIAEHLKPGQ